MKKKKLVLIRRKKLDPDNSVKQNRNRYEIVFILWTGSRDKKLYLTSLTNVALWGKAKQFYCIKIILYFCNKYKKPSKMVFKWLVAEERIICPDLCHLSSVFLQRHQQAPLHQGDEWLSLYTDKCSRHKLKDLHTFSWFVYVHDAYPQRQKSYWLIQ